MQDYIFSKPSEFIYLLNYLNFFLIITILFNSNQVSVINYCSEFKA